MRKRIEDLLENYLEGIETEEEYQELMNLIDSGKVSKSVADNFAKELVLRMESDTEPTEWEQGKLKEVFERIKPSLENPKEKLFDLDELRTTSSIERNKKTLHIWRMAAVAALVLMTAFGTWYTGTVENERIQTEEITTYSYTGPQQITLPDSSTVLLNEVSKLHYENVFGNEYREVWLEGEAFFEVEHDSSTYFVVRTGEIKTTVLGTSFNIKAIENEEEVTVTVNRGVVEVGDEEQIYEQLLADEQLAVNKLTREFKKIQSNDESEISWKNRFIILNDIRLDEAVDIIEERFDVTISIANEELQQLTISATFLEEEGLEHIIKSICLITQSSYTIEENQIQIDGGLGMD